MIEIYTDRFFVEFYKRIAHFLNKNTHFYTINHELKNWKTRNGESHSETRLHDSTNETKLNYAALPPAKDKNCQLPKKLPSNFLGSSHVLVLPVGTVKYCFISRNMEISYLNRVEDFGWPLAFTNKILV